MENTQEIQTTNIEQETKVKTEKLKLNGIAGLKFIAVLLMFYWHSGLTNVIPSVIDFGARGCEFLFVVSGFLVAYNYKRKHDNILKEMLFYSSKKFVKVWPLHVLMALVMLFLERMHFTADKLPSLFMNIFLLQSWHNDYSIIMSFNGTSWFLSSIMFCYLLSPILIKLCKNYKISLICFIVLVAIRVVFDRYIYGLGEISKIIKVHTFPVVRLTEFLMGMLLCPLFLQLNNKINWNKQLKIILFSIFEIIVLAGLIVCMQKVDFTRAEFVVLMALVTFTFAFDGGVISKLFSFQPFRFLSSLQFEFYILHAGILRILQILWFDNLSMPKNSVNLYIIDAIALVVLIGVCFLYRKFLAKHVDRALKKGFNYMFKLTKLDIEI